MRGAPVLAWVCLSFHATACFADVARGDVAFARGDYLAAEHEWRESAAKGSAAAMLGVGALYDTGHGVPQDFTVALSWYQRAAEAGNASAMFNVGAMHDNGRGTQVDRAKAVRWYAMAAKRGNSRAAYALATIYRDGDGVPRDGAAAIKYFQIAAIGGIAAARANLARLGAVAPKANAGLPRPLAALAQPAALPPATVNAEPLRAPAIPVPGIMASAALPDSSAPLPMLPNSPGQASPGIPGGLAGLDSQLAAPVPEADGTAGEIEAFHKAALQHADVDPALAKRYGEVASQIARKASAGDPSAQYDVGFGYERGIGMPSDLVRSYVFYVRATLSPDLELQSAAFARAFEVGIQMSDAQHASATGMLERSSR